MTPLTTGPRRPVAASAGAGTGAGRQRFRRATRRWPSDLGLRTLSDVASVAGELTLGGPPECPDRPTCLGRTSRQVTAWSSSSSSRSTSAGPVSLQALLAGDVDVALLFTTDPSITQNGLVELVDDRQLQPAENVTPAGPDRGRGALGDEAW